MYWLFNILKAYTVYFLNDSFGRRSETYVDDRGGPPAQKRKLKSEILDKAPRGWRSARFGGYISAVTTSLWRNKNIVVRWPYGRRACTI